MPSFSDTFATDTRANYNKFLNSSALVWNGTDLALATNNVGVNIRAYQDTWTIDEDIDYEMSFRTSGTLTGRIELLFKLKDTSNFLWGLFDLSTGGAGLMTLREKVVGTDVILDKDGGGNSTVLSDIAATTTYHLRARATANQLIVGWYDDNGSGGRGTLKQEATYTLIGSLIVRWGALAKGDVGFGWQPGSTSWRLLDLAVTTTAYVTNPPPYFDVGPYNNVRFPSASVQYGSANSFFNRGGVRYSPSLPNSPALVTNLLATTDPDGPGHIVVNTDTAADFDIPLYFAKSTDPQYELVADNEPYGVFPYNGTLIRLPVGAKPAQGGDRHLSVVQPDGTCWDLYKVSAPPTFVNPGGPFTSGGEIHFRWGGYRTNFYNHPDPVLAYGTAIAPGWLAAVGEIRAEEMEDGVIDHAIVCTIRCNGQEYVWPAQKNAFQCQNMVPPESETDKIGMGHRIVLDYTTAEINALAEPEWRKIIYRALANYGAVAGDTNGSSWFLRKECGTMYTSLGYDDPWQLYARELFYTGQTGVSIEGSGNFVLNFRDGNIDWTRLRVVEFGEVDVSAAYELWLNAIRNGDEIAPAGVDPHIFTENADVTRGVVKISNDEVFDFEARMSGGYLVVSDPRIVRFVKETGLFTVVNSLTG